MIEHIFLEWIPKDWITELMPIFNVPLWERPLVYLYQIEYYNFKIATLITEKWYPVFPICSLLLVSRTFFY